MNGQRIVIQWPRSPSLRKHCGPMKNCKQNSKLNDDIFISYDFNEGRENPTNRLWEAS